MEGLQQYFILWVLVLIGLILLTIFVVAPMYLNRKKARPTFPHLVRTALLSPAEQLFFNALQEASAGRYWVFPKVRLEDILEPSPHFDRDQYQDARSRTGSRHIDFLLCEPLSFKPLAAIELDEHPEGHAIRAEKDIFLDDLFAKAGLPLLHYPAGSSYPIAELQGDLNRKLYGSPSVL